MIDLENATDNEVAAILFAFESFPDADDIGAYNDDFQTTTKTLRSDALQEYERRGLHWEMFACLERPEFWDFPSAM